jgi:tRNA(fMet)-specific endonuclease VapC
MANKIYMLDTCICSFIMREHPVSVLQKLQAEVAKQNRIVISAITYAEMRYGAIGKKASPKHSLWVDEFVQRLDDVLAWGVTAVDAALIVKKHLNDTGKLIGENDIAIAGHAISENCILVTNNTREFKRVENLKYEDWVH